MAHANLIDMNPETATPDPQFPVWKITPMKAFREAVDVMYIQAGNSGRALRTWEAYQPGVPVDRLGTLMVKWNWDEWRTHGRAVSVCGQYVIQCRGKIWSGDGCVVLEDGEPIAFMPDVLTARRYVDAINWPAVDERL